MEQENKGEPDDSKTEQAEPQAPESVDQNIKHPRKQIARPTSQKPPPVWTRQQLTDALWEYAISSGLSFVPPPRQREWAEKAGVRPSEVEKIYRSHCRAIYPKFKLQCDGFPE